MARTLSTNVTNGKAGDSIPVWLVEIDYGPPNSLTTLRYATLGTADFPTAWSGTAFTAVNLKKNGIGDIQDKCDVSRGGNVAEPGGLTLRLGNGGLISDTIDTYHFYNRRVEVRLIFADQTSPTWANAAPVFYGYSQFPYWDYNELVLQVKGGWLARHKNIPVMFLSKSLEDELPDENDTQVFPILFGNWLLNGGAGINASGIASNLSPSSSSIVLHDYFKGFLHRPLKYGDVGTGSDRPYTVYAGHDILSRSYPTPDGRLVRGVSERDVFALENIKHQQIMFGTGVSGAVADFVFKASSTMFRTLHIVPILDSTATSGATNPTYAVDEDDTNYTVLDANGETVSYEIPTNSGNTKGREAQNVDWKFRIDAVSRVDDKVQYQISKNGSVFISWTNVSAYGSFVTIDIATAASPNLGSENGSYSGYQIEFKYVDVGSHDAGCEFRIKSVYVHIDELTDEDVPYIMQTGKGRFYHSFIDVANHSNSYSAGDLIENPAYIVESLAYHDLGLTPAALSKSLDFDGSNNYASVKHSEALALTGDFTLVAWVYPDNFTNVSGLLRKALTLSSTVPANFDWYLAASSGLPNLKLGDGSTSATTAATNPPAATGAWVHLAVKVSGTTVTHYRNGATNGSGTNSATRADLGGDLIFGLAAQAGTPYLNGRLDEVQIYNRALSDAEILADYNNGTGVRHKAGEDGLVGLWHFDEGYGSEYRDSSGNNNSGCSISTYAASWADGKVVSTQQIKESDFDGVGVVRTDWLFARQVTNKVNSRELIRQICYEGAFAYLTRPDGLDSLARIDPYGSPSTLTTADVLMNGDKSSMKVRRADPSIVKNYFILHYKKNMATDKFENTLYVNNPTSAEYDSKFTNLASDGDVYWRLCSASFAKFQQVGLWEYNAEWIRDDATAELFIKFMIEKLTRLPLIVEFDTTLKNIGISLFDQYLIDHPLMPGAENAYHHMLVTDQVIHPASDTITLTFLDIGVPA